MSHNVQWKPQFSLSLIPLFPFTFFSLPKEQFAFLNHRCVCACVCVSEHAHGGIPNRLPMMSYYGDGKYQAEWPVCCKIVYLEHCTLSLADCDFFVAVISAWIHSAPSGYLRSTLFWGVPACGLFTHRALGAWEDKSTCMLARAYNMTNDACGNSIKDTFLMTWWTGTLSLQFLLVSLFNSFTEMMKKDLIISADLMRLN